MAPFPQRSLSRCSLQPRVPSTKTSLFSNPWLCQVILPALTLGLNSGTTQNSTPEGLRHTAPGRCEAQTCSQQLAQVHLAQGVAFRCLPLDSFVLTLLHSQSYLKQSRGEAFHVEQAGAMPGQTGWCRSQTSGRDKMKHSGNKPTLLIIKLFVMSHKLCSFSSFHCLHMQESQ